MPERDLRIELVNASEAEKRTRDALLDLLCRFDLSRFEYTDHVRIEEGAIPHSHPVLTLGTAAPNEGALLSSYLHEQLHWFVYEKDLEVVEQALAELAERYPNPPVGLPEGAKDEQSTYLHYIVNYLELLALSDLFGREKAERAVSSKPFYREIYATVLRDASALDEICTRFGLTP